MGVRRLAIFFLVCLACSSAIALAGSSATAPRFSLSASVATPGEEVTIRLSRRPRPFKQALRLYLVPEVAVAEVRSRFDPRLTFVGSVTPKSPSKAFTVPPLQRGLYALAYWCRGCAFPRGRDLAVQRLVLRVETPEVSGTCPVTRPNGSTPPGAQPSVYFHGIGGLWVFLPLEGVLRTDEADGTLFEKMIWAGAGPGGRHLTVRYERLDSSDPPRNAETIAGQLGGYSGESWASRMYLSIGCWRVTGRVGDASLTFIVEVARA
jgi:hypothetical protein